MLRLKVAALAIMMASAAQAAAPMVDGQVTAIDLGRKMITLNHNAIPNVQMPAMIMTFGVADDGMISDLKAGDHVEFTADFVDGTLMVTSIQLQ